MIDHAAIRLRYEALDPLLDERSRRRFAAAEALAAGRGGVTAVARVTGVARSTIDRGLAKLRGDAAPAAAADRVRRKGGGRRPLVVTEQFELFADRASSATMAANQLRMWFSAMAYVLVDTLRRVGLRHTQFADAAAQTIRLKLLRLGAQSRISARRIYFAIVSGCPNHAEFALAHIRLWRAFSSA